MPNIMYRDLISRDLQVYQDFFLHALVEDEDSFRISCNDEKGSPFPTRNQADSFTHAAFADGQLAGVASFERDGKNREKLRHKGIVFRVYVAPPYRGLGISKKLIAAIIERAKQLPDLESLHLTVMSNNPFAKTVYEKLGFTRYGTETRSVKCKGKYFDEDLMRLQL